MKFQVIGSNRETGARMTLEFEAESKAAAERKATQSGMSVSRVVDITDGHPTYSTGPRAARRRSGGKWVSMIVLIALVVLAWHYWPWIMHAVRR